MFNLQIDQVHYPNAVVTVTEKGVLVDGKLIARGTLEQVLVKKDDETINKPDVEVTGFVSKSIPDSKSKILGPKLENAISALTSTTFMTVTKNGSTYGCVVVPIYVGLKVQSAKVICGCCGRGNLTKVDALEQCRVCGAEVGLKMGFSEGGF